MSGLLDQSLDTIMKDRRTSNRRTRGGRPAADKKVAAPKAPVGGVKKHVKGAKPAAKNTFAATPSGESKILVSNLPPDVSEKQIKDYFTSQVGPVKKVLVQYGPNGQSRGIATIIFSRGNSAAVAAKDLDNIKVDGRPMKIEVILSAKDAPTVAPPKALADRVQKPKEKPKSQPKPVTAAKPARGAKSVRGRAARGGRTAGRGKPKTAEELDAEMQDYFVANPNGEGEAPANNSSAAQPAASGDDGMADVE